MESSGPINEESHFFSDNEEKFEEYFNKPESDDELVGVKQNPNLESLQYLSTTYLSRNMPVFGNETQDIIEETQNEIIDDEDESADDSDQESDSDDNYSDNLSSINISDSQSLSMISNINGSDMLNDQNLNLTKAEQLKMIYLRSFLDKVGKNFKEKDITSSNIQQEIVSCKQRLNGLEMKRNVLFQKLEKSQDEENITVSKRLDAEHKTVCEEIELETHVLTKLKEAYDDADYARNKALLEKTKYVIADKDLRKQEEVVANQKLIKAKLRIDREEKRVDLFKSKLEKAKLEEKERIMQENLKQKETIEKARVSRQLASTFLNQTLKEFKSKKEAAEASFTEEFETKKKSLLNLKQTIDHNKEMFQAKVNKNKFNEVKRQQKLLEEKSAFLERGENPNFFIPRQKRMEEVERTKKKFEQEQHNNTQDIVKKILREKENLEKKQRLYPNLFNINLKPLPNKIPADQQDKQKNELKMLGKIANTLGYSDDNISQFLQLDSLDDRLEDEAEDVYERRSMTTTIASKDDDDESDFDELNDQDDCLVKPEFEGLWNVSTKKYDADDLYKKQVKFPACFQTKAEQDLYLKSLEQLKKSAVREQVVARRKFVGVSFKSNPQIIHFKDFTVGQSYLIKVVLTNISYTINTCKFVEITESLKDFIDIDFHPPGQLSAGLTCEFNVSFKPMINKDLSGELQFLASNGPFSIPISCTIKKCDLSVSSESVYFGTVVILEEVSRRVQLVNKGALGTSFKIVRHKDLISPVSGEEDRNEEEEEKQKKESETAEGIRLCSVKEGIIGPFQTVELEFYFSSSFPGKFQENYFVQFEDEDSKQLSIVTKATAIDVPIWIENLNIDLKICMYDRLYQEVIRVHNRASAALRITFEVPSDLKNHLEILPKTAFIQAKSDFSAQLKFVAKSSLSQEAVKYFDPSTGVLELPLHIRVADQNKTVDYNLHAIVTTSDLEFDLKEIDFGYCTIYETVRATVNLTNKSILCQPFGFIKLPEFVNVQPNDGFGTLLPNETIPIDINFCPKSAKDFKFTIVCKSLVNRDFCITCCGIGVHPPLKLSAQRINFKATSLNSTSFQSIYVKNEHVDYEQHRHPVPRIGNGEIARVGPTWFEFDLPDNCPFKLSPSVGQVVPGEKVKITVQYTAKLDDAVVKQQALKIIKQRMSENASLRAAESQPVLTAITEAAADSDSKSKKKPPPPKVTAKTTASSDRPTPSSSMSVTRGDLKTPDMDFIDINSQEYTAAYNQAMETFESGLEHFQIPCYVSTVQVVHEPGQPIPYNIHNTLYLDVVCPSIRPEIITLTNPATRCINFGKVSIGHKSIQKICIKNISESTIELKSSILDTDGPFVLLNSIRTIKPGAIINLIIGFIPNKSSIFRENFEIQTVNSNLSFVFNAVGVEPSFSLSFDGHVLDFGYCLTNERTEKSIEMKNNSNVPISFKITLDSANDQLRAENDKKRFLNLNDLRYKPAIGPNNYSGQSSFDVFPLQGTIQPSAKIDFKVLFSPDHTSELYADVMRISMLSTDKNSRVIQLHGKSRKSIIYIKGVDTLTGNSNNESSVLNEVEPLSVSAEGGQELVNAQAAGKGAADSVENGSSIPIPIMLSLYSIASSKYFGEYSTAEKIIQIGAMKSAPTKEGKKSGDFSFENLKDINAKGFNIDLAKSAIEFGGERQVKVTWKPPPGMDIKQTIQTSILITTKANMTEIWRLILQGRVVSETFHVSQ